MAAEGHVHPPGFQDGPDLPHPFLHVGPGRRGRGRIAVMGKDRMVEDHELPALGGGRQVRLEPGPQGGRLPVAHVQAGIQHDPVDVAGIEGIVAHAQVAVVGGGQEPGEARGRVQPWGQGRAILHGAVVQGEQRAVQGIGEIVVIGQAVALGTAHPRPAAPFPDPVGIVVPEAGGHGDGAHQGAPWAGPWTVLL